MCFKERRGPGLLAVTLMRLARSQHSPAPMVLSALRPGLVFQYSKRGRSFGHLAFLALTRHYTQPSSVQGHQKERRECSFWFRAIGCWPKTSPVSSSDVYQRGLCCYGVLAPSGSSTALHKAFWCRSQPNDGRAASVVFT